MALAARRTAAPGVLVLFALAALVLVRRDWAGEVALLEAADGTALERGFSRAGVWLGLTLIALLAGVGQAAALVGRWRAGESDWLAPRRASRPAGIASSWAGVVLAGGAILAATGVLAEWAAGGAPPTWRDGGSLLGRDVTRSAGGARVGFHLPDPRAREGARLAFDLGLRFDSGVSSELLLRVRRAEGPGPWIELARRLGTAASLELDVPAGSGELEVEIERLGEGALIVLAPRARLWTPARAESRASLALLAHATLALAALSALALGFSSWTRPALGLALLLALMMGFLLSGAEPTPLAPGSSLPASLATVQAGRVPPAPGLAECAGALLSILVGLGLANSGHSPWRRGA